MKAIVTLVALLSLALVPASDPTGVALWKASDLVGRGKELALKVDAKGVATADLGVFGNHKVMMAHRISSGEAEWHEKQADVFIVQSGAAILVVGGDVVEGKTTAPGEIRGSAIKGGERKTLGAGDMVHIPARTAHQVLLDPGKSFDYVIIKVDAQ